MQDFNWQKTNLAEGVIDFRIEILGCPFCGKQDHIVFTSQYSEPLCDFKYKVWCRLCDIYGPRGYTEVDSVLKWNHRHDQYRPTQSHSSN